MMTVQGCPYRLFLLTSLGRRPRPIPVPGLFVETESEWSCFELGRKRDEQHKRKAVDELRDCNNKLKRGKTKSFCRAENCRKNRFAGLSDMRQIALRRDSDVAFSRSEFRKRLIFNFAKTDPARTCR
jgi:hypothetical protein